MLFRYQLGSKAMNAAVENRYAYEARRWGGWATGIAQQGAARFFKTRVDLDESID